jgi:hypothetical protein
MDKQKQTFIESLLTNKRLKPGQRERVLALAARELGVSGSAELVERVERIEGVVFAKAKKVVTSAGPFGTFDFLVEDWDILEPSEPKPLVVSGDEGFDQLRTTALEGESGKSVLITDTKPKAPQKKIAYAKPAILYKFLYEFNQNEILKSTCHDIDLDELKKIREYCGTGESYDYVIHQKKVADEFESLVNKVKPSYKVAALIRAYLTGKWKKDSNFPKSGWSSDVIDYHWLHEDLLKWVEDNKEWPPHLSEGLTLEYGVAGPEIKRFKSNITGETITYFRDLVLHFKNMFHLRYDNSLYSIIKHTNKTEKWKDQAIFETDDQGFPKNIELFTDVDKVKQAYKKIVWIIIDAQKKADPNEKPVIQVSLTESLDRVVLVILHKDSTYQKSIQSTLDRSFGRDYTSLIKSQVNGVCNLYLKADFGQEGYGRVNLWNGEERRKVECEPIQGVQHELVFIKTSA